MTPELVIFRLERAGIDLLSMPAAEMQCRLHDPNMGVVCDALRIFGWTRTRTIQALPSMDAVIRMREAFDWLSLIPADRYVIRRVVGARSLVHPVTDRYLFPWRRLATSLGADNKAVQRWHAQGIDMIVAGLERKA